MTLIRWAPFRELETLQREMNQLFDTISVNGDRGVGPVFAPAVELHETPEAVVLKVEIPGLQAQDLDIQATAEAVVIKGERKSESRTEEKGVVRSEFRYGSFSRMIPMPVRIQNDSIQAEYKDGIVTLTLPKAESEKNKVVKVSLN